MSAIPIPLANLLEAQALLLEASNAQPIDFAAYEGSLTQRLAKASGALSFYTACALQGITVPVQEATS
ncbi:hypothetical protein [Variovorax sp. PAMC 28711]|uniref:hypothetical protein n=1 Tax=Variovorax sp. PAMC 28711 TaxID=1795631 RepID=UPI00078E057D|nr:hypothetical protein [Variovorax sp. PAMC 28711]AMM23020.1 hypothetical protein AX767_00450 [Variovorax sp. PAMC 28711]